MSTDPTTLAQRVSSSYSKLSAVANDLNVVSDELGKAVSHIDEGLKKLNLGVSSWVSIYSGNGGRDPQDTSFWSEDIGWAKVNAKWCICLRRIDGDYRNPDDESETRWIFNDAARTLRLAAIDKIPDLLEQLSAVAADTTNKIQAKLADVQAVAMAMTPEARRSNIVPRGLVARALTAAGSQRTPFPGAEVSPEGLKGDVSDQKGKVKRVELTSEAQARLHRSVIDTVIAVVEGESKESK